MATAAEVKPVLATSALSVFLEGTFNPTSITVNTSSGSSPPKPLFIVCPKEEGTFNVILFLHGTSLKNNSYSQLFQFIASHGFIIVAPQLYTCMPPSGNKEVESAAEVTNWLPTGLQSNLPQNVKANLNLLALMGHSRGGQSAFALALPGYAKDPQVALQFSAIIGIDPVAGTARFTELDPPLLSVDSFNFSTPVAVIGTGLGGQAKCMAPCAPEGANYEKFFSTCTNSSRALFVAADYGHMDVLDDNPSDVLSWAMSKCMCTNGKGSRDPMRRCVGGIVVAFLEDYFDKKTGDFETIVKQPSVAPAKLDSVEFIPVSV